MAQNNDDPWYVGLSDENCRPTMDLLGENPKLVMQGWEENEQLTLKSRPWTKHWKGRTALHVAVRRGCLELAELVFKIFEEEEKQKSPVQNDQNSEVVPDSSNPQEVGETRSLHQLLLAKDGTYHLDALAMAVVTGSPQMIDLLKEASLKRETNPYQVMMFRMDQRLHSKVNHLSEDMSKLKKILGAITLKLSGPEIDRLTKLYQSYKNFNFLPMDEYLFHFVMTGTLHSLGFLTDLGSQIIIKVGKSSSLLRVLFELQDGQGRPPLHVAVDYSTVKLFLDLVPEGDYLNIRDGAGRTPLHRTLASSGGETSFDLLIHDERTDVNATWSYPKIEGIDINDIAGRNGFKQDETGFSGSEEYTALHLAIIHKRRSFVERIFRKESKDLDKEKQGILGEDLDKEKQEIRREDLDKEKQGILRKDLDKEKQGRRSEVNEWKDSKCQQYYRFCGKLVKHKLGSLQLATVVGDTSILKLLVKDSRMRDPGKIHSLLHNLWASLESDHVGCDEWSPLAAVHLAAASGKPHLLKLFLDEDSDCNPMITDFLKNNVFHYVNQVGGQTQLTVSFAYYISCLYFATQKELKSEATQKELKSEAVRNAEECDRRKQCINLLLNNGSDILNALAPNTKGEIPSPAYDAPIDFSLWWDDRMTKEIVDLQSKIDSGLNSVILTATLVATASYVGPLQPPLGYGLSSAGIQTDILLVRVFIVCDTLSFYFAVAAIMSGVIPFLPLPILPMRKDMVKRRKMLGSAVLFLLPSILFVVIAFVSSSIVVVGDDGSWSPEGLSSVTAIIGGILILKVFFSSRLREVISYEISNYIRHLWKAVGHSWEMVGGKKLLQLNHKRSEA